VSPDFGMPSADPVAVYGLRAGLALLLAAAAGHKWRAPHAFRIALADYQLLPPGWVAPVARALPVGEGLLAAGLLVPDTARSAALAAALLLGVYAAAMGINLARGRDQLSCGCLGPAADAPLHAGLLVRNGLLAAAALAASASPAARPWTGLDGLSLAGAVASFALLYLAGESLLAASRRRLVS